MKNKLKRKDLLLLTLLLTRTAPVWGMDPDDRTPVASKHPQILHIESNTNTTCSPIYPRGHIGGTLQVQTSLSEELLLQELLSTELSLTGLQPQKAKAILSEETDQKVLDHLKNFGLPSQKIEIIWQDFTKIITAKGQIHPFILASFDPHFIASGLWRAHLEMSEKHKNSVKPLPLRSMLSCLLTKEFSYKNKKTQPDEVQFIKSLIQSNPYFTTLEFFKAGITDNHLTQMGTIPHLKELSLEENEVTDKGLDFLMVYPNLHRLNLAKNKVTPIGAGILAKSQTLKHVNLYKNPIGDDGAELLSYNTILSFLDLRETGIGDRGAKALGTNNKTLTDLRLRYNKITDTGAEAFLNSHHLTHLELARNQISDEHVFFLEHLMPSNGYLNKLQDHKALPQSALPSQKDRVRILSIDGGGIRGLLPGVVLKYVEDGLTQKTGSQFYFALNLDLVAGTSTGGIISLGMIMPGERGRPKYTVQTLIDLYTTKGREIFPGPWCGLPGIFTATYPPQNLEIYLEKYFEETFLSESLCPTLITSFDLKNNKSHTFDSHKAKKKESKNFLIRGTGRATSAAPTYFPAAKIKNKLGEEFELVDGGIYANNPTLLAIKRAQQLYPDAKEIAVYSFGTGQTSKTSLAYLGNKGLLKWGLNIANVLMDNAAEYTEELIKAEVKKDPRIKYVRIQPEIQISEKEMDNVDPENIENLLKTAQTTIDEKKDILDAMIEEFYRDFEKK